ncbi:MAG: sigma-54 dependent transcriptional regulator [Rhodobacteraceae bacterium]|nr:sigma-54 dependent transcriptional regulator [Paracoccaceae bacterium]
MSRSILLVEDTQSLAMVYRAVLEKNGFQVESAKSLFETRNAIAAREFSTVLLDLMLPDGDGMDVISEILGSNPETKVIVITANGSINRAIDAMRLGAFDYLVKPFDEKRLIDAVRNADKTFAEVGKNPEVAVVNETGFNDFIGLSPAMVDIYKMINNIGRSLATVFITGESGTGKEVAAQAIHAVSGRSKGPFVPLNCGAIPADLLESEVFGHLKGSFTGAIADKKGAAAMASGGTLFLDEICEMDLALQTKLLRFLETSKIQPVGATSPVSVDVRILCATNRNPEEEVRQGRFREDLYYRLHVVPIHMPALRDRRQDILAIAQSKLVEFAKEEGKAFVEFSDDVKERLFSLNWPGNVRQLLNVLRNIVVLNDGAVVTMDMLPAEVSEQKTAGPDKESQTIDAIAEAETQPETQPPQAFVEKTLAQMEREFVEATIAHCDGSVPKAAIILDVSPSTIYRKREAWKT